MIGSKSTSVTGLRLRQIKNLYVRLTVPKNKKIIFFSLWHQKNTIKHVQNAKPLFVVPQYHKLNKIK